MTGDNLRERRHHGRVERNCRACAALTERARYNAKPKGERHHGGDLAQIRASIRANMPGVVMSQEHGLFYAKKGCHPNSALGQAITSGDRETRLRVLRNRSLDDADRRSLEWWARRGCAA